MSESQEHSLSKSSVGSVWGPDPSSAPLLLSAVVRKDRAQLLLLGAAVQVSVPEQHHSYLDAVPISSLAGLALLGRACSSPAAAWVP